MILLFHLRSLINTTKWDAFNADSWREMLEPFGFVVDSKLYNEMLVSDSDQEIHSCLLPITPWDQFEALQKSRYRNLETCITAARPLEGHSSPFPLHAGVVDFLKSLPRTGDARYYVYLLTNIAEDIVRKVLARTEVGAALCDLFDGILVSTASGQSYRNFVSNIRQGGTAADVTRPPKDSAFVSFETSAAGVKLARKANIKPIGLAVSGESARALSEAGACVAVGSYSDLKPQYLPILVAK